MLSVTFDLGCLPQDENVEFEQSTFFSRGHVLPTTAEVRSEAVRQSPEGISSHRPRPVFYPDINLVVKYGIRNSIAEGQCMWLIKRYMKDEVPVPEVYAWKRDGAEFFLYMELVSGVTLKSCWNELMPVDKGSVCHDLRASFHTLRSLRQDADHPFVGECGNT
jgi:hypothetical protein